ncbi:MAG: hypothetical protein M3Y87_27795 [Myxococcota bacterium]|nr:hypothetical protein [Myxococcota bacterium]
MITITRKTQSGAELLVAWGGTEGFRLELVGVDIDALALRAGSIAIDGERLAVGRLVLREGRIALVGVSLGRARIGADLAPTRDGGALATEETKPASEEPTRVEEPRERPIVDWRFLDGLSGAVNVDVRVDLAVPIIGHRRATHRFRIPIAAGSIDYLRLESDLSLLENTLLDFAVRDGALVLERGIPLLPTRGRGAPILMWDLSPEDLALANQSRVRLGVLPTFRMAGGDAGENAANEAETSSGGSAISLRELKLDDVDVHLQLAPPPSPLEGAIATLAFDSLVVQGSLAPVGQGPPAPGALRGDVEGLRAGIGRASLGDRRLGVGGLRVEHLQNVRLSFHGRELAALECELAELAVDTVELDTVGAASVADTAPSRAGS